MSSAMQMMLPRWAVIRDARRRQRRRWRRRAGALLVVAAAAGAGVLIQHSGAPPRIPGRAAVLPPSTVALGGSVLAAQTAGGHIWVDTCVQLCGIADTGLDTERLVEVDAASGTVIRRTRPLTNVAGFTAAGRDVWVSHFRSGDVARLDPVSGRVTANVHLRLPRPVAAHDRAFLPGDLSFARGYIWVSTARGWLAQVRAATGRLVRMVPTPSEDNATAIDRHGVWVAEDLDGIGLLSPHARHLRIHTIMQSGLPLDVYGVFASGGSVFAIAETYSTDAHSPTIVLTIDPRNGRVTHRVSVPTRASGSALAGGSLYLADLARGRIYRVGRDGLLRRFRTSRSSAWLATASPGALWAAQNGGRGGRGRLLRIRLPGA